MDFFYKKLDTRSRVAMMDFLASHFRYGTGNNWNMGRSYAHNVKIHSLGLTNPQKSAAYDVLGGDYWNEIQYPIDTFTAEMKGEWTIGFNGRSSGYLVLYSSRYEYTEHQSRCTQCGQLNFKAVMTQDALREALGMQRIDGIWPLVQEVFQTINSLCQAKRYVGNKEIVQQLNEHITDTSILESVFVQPINRQGMNAMGVAIYKLYRNGATLGNECGWCGAHARQNLKNRIRQLKISAKSVDSDQDFSEWDIGSLRDRVRLVQRFDKACDHIRSVFIALCDDEAAAEVTDKAA